MSVQPVEAAATDPYAVPDYLAERVASLGLEPHIRDFVDRGYTVIQDPVAHALADRVREAIVRLAKETEGPASGYSAALLLGRDPVFEEAVLAPKMHALAEYVVGRGAILSQLIGSVRPKGGPAIPLHADHSWFPAPFPEWSMLVTACWATDEYTKEGGCTLVMPGTNKQRRHPTAEARKSLEGAIPVECPQGSIVMWDGNVWHANYPREIDGDRVVLHTTYGRIGVTPVEDYRHLDEGWLAGRPAEMRTLLGREVFLGSTTATSGGASRRLLQNTYAQVHGPRFFGGESDG